jgi:hypothetical protein
MRPFHRCVDPYDEVISLNIRRRHLTTERKHELIDKLLLENPGRSDRAIAQQVQVSHPTVGARRGKLVTAGVVPPVTMTKGRDGKVQRVTRARRYPPMPDPIFVEPVPNTPEPASVPETAPATIVDAPEERSGPLEGLELMGARLIREYGAAKVAWFVDYLASLPESKAELAELRKSRPQQVQSVPAWDKPQSGPATRDRIISLFYKGRRTYAEIALEVGCSIEFVHQVLDATDDRA